MNYIKHFILILTLGFFTSCSIGFNQFWNLSPLVKYKSFPMQRVIDRQNTWNQVSSLTGIDLYNYYRNVTFQSHNGWISNSTYPFAFNPKGSVSLVSNGISYDTVYYPENDKLLVVWVSNSTTNYLSIFYEMTTNERYIHANRKYIAFQKGDMLYVIQTNGITNWSHNVKYMSYIFRFANGTSPVFVYGEYMLDNAQERIDNNVPYRWALQKHSTYLYNIETMESNYIGLAQDIIGFSAKNKLIFYNMYNGYSYDFYYLSSGNIFLTNSGMLAAYHISEKRIQPIGDIGYETNRKIEDCNDMVIGITKDLSKFYVLEDYHIGLDDRFTNETGKEILGSDLVGVWEIDISSLGLKDE